MGKPVVRWAVGWFWPPGIPEQMDACLCSLLPAGARVTLYGLGADRYVYPIVGLAGDMVIVCRNAEGWYGIQGYGRIHGGMVHSICRLIAADYVNKGGNDV